MHQVTSQTPCLISDVVEIVRILYCIRIVPNQTVTQGRVLIAMQYFFLSFLKFY